MPSSSAKTPAGTANLPRELPPPLRCGPRRRSRRGPQRALVLIAVHVAILAHIAHWKIAGTTLSPLEPSEAMQTLELGYLNAGFALFALLILTTALAGRFFCGWACHVVAYQDLCAWLLGKVGLRPRPLRSRLLALVPAGAAMYMFVWPQVERWLAGRGAPGLSLHLTTSAFWETFPGPGIAILTLMIDGALVVYLLGSKGFCTYGCPYGAVFGLADRLAPMRIRVDENCDGCGHCTAACTSAIRVHEEVRTYGAVVSSGCMKCLDCVDVCPRGALRLAPGRPAPLLPARGPRIRRVGDLGWGEEALLGAAFLGGLFILRGLYDLVPFLLAIGLAVLTALGALTAWRLARGRDLCLQNHDLRRDGRLTRGGRAALALLGLWALFLLHSGWVHYHMWRGEHILKQVQISHGLQREEIDLLGSAAGHLLDAERLGLVTPPRLEYMLGAILYRQGDLGGARERLERAVRREPSMAHAGLLLAEVLAAGGELAAAEGRLRALIAARSSWSAPLLPLAKLLIRRGAYAEAERWLVRLRQLEPNHPELERWLELARSRIKSSR